MKRFLHACHNLTAALYSSSLHIAASNFFLLVIILDKISSLNYIYKWKDVFLLGCFVPEKRNRIPAVPQGLGLIFCYLLMRMQILKVVSVERFN